LYVVVIQLIIKINQKKEILKNKKDENIRWGNSAGAGVGNEAEKFFRIWI